MLFNRTWFTNHQRILLFLLNTPIIKHWFRWVLCINGNRSSVGSNKIIKISPNAIVWVKDYQKLLVATEFRTHDKFAKRLYYAFLPLWYIFHAWDMFIANPLHPSLNLGFDSTGNLYPAAGANSPMDGYVYRNGVNEVLNTIRTSSGSGNDGATDTLLVCRLQASTTSNQFQLLIRDIMCFDTSSIGATNTISAATLSVYADASRNTGLGTSAFHIGSATPASTSAIANSDYLQCGTTSFGSIAGGSWGTSAYQDITLNASGLANISKTGVSKFSAQTDWDINNSFTGAWSSGAQTDFQGRAADQTGTSNDPKLVVTYSAPTTGASFLLNFI